MEVCPDSREREKDRQRATWDWKVEERTGDLPLVVHSLTVTGMSPAIMAQNDDKPLEKKTLEELRAMLPWTPPYDPRFPNQNQTRNCYTNYLDYHRCVKVKGEDYEPCNYFKRAYQELCFSDWHEKWDEQRAKGIFPGKI